MTERAWTAADVHEALLRWGRLAARLDDGGLGYPSQSSGIVELRQRPYRALDPCDLLSSEFAAIDAAVGGLAQQLKVVVLCYYKPGHLRGCFPGMGADGKGRQRSPSYRAIGAFMLVSKDMIDARLRTARNIIADHLTRSAGRDRIAVNQ